MKVKKKAVYTLFYITCVSVLIMLITIPALFAKNKQIKLLKSEIENNTKQIETLNSHIEELNEEINELTIVEDETKEYRCKETYG